ncbi:hypothetical protein F5Y17DRAFT_468457 [Xylariaceae sp. FL0594]|nr:hypothetical protein F5Y17DRAFT_468457 [Xylariaceae sp. FL0594]
MRYEDWDILLFPKDSKVPMKEFKTNCHGVSRSNAPVFPEFAYTHGSYGLPTMTCFMPGLQPGTPFNISLHSWKTPDISQFARNYTKHPEAVKFEARVFIDGRLVATSSFKRTGPWPQLINHSFEFTKNGDLEILKFPQFRSELLRQSYWSPADEVGRIKIIISEGFPRDSLTVPTERIKNIIAFSFQHAPLEILESSGIAWPNPAMWRRGPFNPTMPVPTQQHEDGADAHTHSPRKRGKSSGLSLGSNATTVSASQMNATNFFDTMPNVQNVLNRGVTNGLQAVYTDPFNPNKADMSSYFDWPSSVGTIGQSQVLDSGKMKLPDRTKVASHDKVSSSDTSMPDYCSSNSNSNHLPTDFRHNMMVRNAETSEDGPGSKAPTNTSSTLVEPTFMAGFGIGLHKTGTPDDMSSHTDFLTASDACFSSELATSLTHSLLNQPHPLPTHGPHIGMPASEIKSRKENRFSDDPVTEDKMDMNHIDMRKVSQAVYGQPDRNAQGRVSATHSPQSQDTFPGGFSHRPLSALEFGNDLTNSGILYGNSNVESNISSLGIDSRVGSGSDKAARRTRQFTPASAKAIDDEDEPRRSSPRHRAVVGE